jgi:hypothetical protein
MNLFPVKLLLASLCLTSVGFSQTYTTSFPLTENPISENGKWISGAKTGLDWGDVSTTPGQTHPHPGPARYADATALLTGTWGPDQTAQATVWTGNPSNYPEVELRLRSTLSAHVCNGYEITFSLAPNAYLIIVRWNGPLASYNIMTNLSGSQYQAKAGDVVKATIVGNLITAYKNGVQMGQATDNTYTSGNPGIGFNEQQNGDYGYTTFTASSQSTSTVALKPMESSQLSSTPWSLTGIFDKVHGTPYFLLCREDLGFSQAYDVRGRQVNELRMIVAQRHRSPSAQSER